ncbi:MAG TPA: UDP-N-acetylmuramoyl-L-alanyl-D-glutamate--2,6-diaminopimelate ligase [Candidatus Binatia bacterium]|jgi:UDP-N-acetylmuramoyl-L-alanyl-D-glutamate--2,6-diaminopimelate ligase
MTAAARVSPPGVTTLGELLCDLGALRATLTGDAATEIRGISADSRTVAAGDLFVALPGTRTDGARYVAEACARGAAAVAGTADLARAIQATGAGAAPIARVETAEPARFLAHVAARLHGDPTRDLTMVGVTGTNGKTTTTYLLEAIWQAAGLRPGVLGTISYRFGGDAVAAPLTTPPAPELFARLAAMRGRGGTHVAMEVSSHALVQDRVDGIAWDAAVFTNLGRDHLDFHRDVEDYFQAKARLFRALEASPKARRIAIVNTGDPRGRELLRDLRVPAVTFGEGGDVRAEDVTMTLDGSTFTLALPGARAAVRTSLIGAGHIENVLAAAATAHALGASVEAIARGVEGFAGVPGRLEPVRTGQPFSVLVDYAHKPEALASVLGSLRTMVGGRLLCVFGCGGDRDRGKRPLMAEAVAAGADLAVLTSDNPRTEDPLAIIADAEAGLASAALPRLAALGGAARGYVVEPDRARAIGAALAAARPGDCVVIAGKGHEDYQIVGTVKLPFDDRDVARRALAERRP